MLGTFLGKFLGIQNCSWERFQKQETFLGTFPGKQERSQEHLELRLPEAAEAFGLGLWVLSRRHNAHVPDRL